MYIGAPLIRSLINSFKPFIRSSTSSAVQSSAKHGPPFIIALRVKYCLIGFRSTVTYPTQTARSVCNDELMECCASLNDASLEIATTNGLNSSGCDAKNSYAFDVWNHVPVALVCTSLLHSPRSISLYVRILITILFSVSTYSGTHTYLTLFSTTSSNASNSASVCSASAIACAFRRALNSS